jgi:hypothetical protein
MKLSDFKNLTRRGHLVRQIIKEEWPMRLGDWRAVEERCDLLADTAPKEAEIRKWEAKAVKDLLYREGLIAYDTDSGLWYCLVVAPRQDYPDGWQSDALVERKKRQAEREALGLNIAPKPKAKRKPKSATPPQSPGYWINRLNPPGFPRRPDYI